MYLYRVSKIEYANELNGIGASKYGGRWNSQGVEMIYTAENKSLAILEVLVHISSANVPKDYKIIKIFVPNNTSVESLELKDLSKNWNKFPYKSVTQLKGNEFIRRQKSCMLKVPSAIVPGEFNLLINPNHLEFKDIKILKIEDFVFDKRLLQNLSKKK